MTFTKIHDGRYRGYSYSGPKWACDVCHRSGYGDPAEERGYYGHWSDACKRGHSPCPWCDRQLTLRMDGTPRVHSRCPDRPRDAELLREAAAEARHTARRGVRGPLDAGSVALLDRLTHSSAGSSGSSAWGSADTG